MKTNPLQSAVALVVLLVISQSVSAQEYNFGQLGQAAYDKQAYADGAPLFLLAAQLEPNAAAGHIYNAACCYALAKQKDLAFYSLGVAIKKGWRNKSHAEGDEDLASLRSDPRWKELLEKFPPTSEVSDNRDAIINDLNNLAAFSYQYRIRPSNMGGGEGSYAGFTIPPKMKSNANATFETLTVEPNLVRFRASSAKGNGTVESSIDDGGRLKDWKYSGKFAEPPKEIEGLSPITTNRDALINWINSIAAFCYQYRIRPASMGGGEGAYSGIKLPEKLSVSDDGTFGVIDVQADKVKIEAVSKKVKGSITTILDANGRLGPWTYFGELQ
jgi:hypothetical protein